MTKSNNHLQMLPLTPARIPHILLFLTGEPKHSYAVMKHVGEITNGQMTMGPGTLYGTIKRMLAAGLIEESDDAPDSNIPDEQRRYYRLTPFGEQILKTEVKRISHLVRFARSKKLLTDAE